MALIGGLLTPALLHTDRNQYRSFFMYLFALDAGALALLKHWRGLSSIAYFGTQLLSGSGTTKTITSDTWSGSHLSNRIILSFPVGPPRKRTHSSRAGDSRRCDAVAGQPVHVFRHCLSPLNPTHHDWMGAFAIGMALVYSAPRSCCCRVR
jgi:hypothetical protein